MTTAYQDLPRRSVPVVDAHFRHFSRASASCQLPLGGDVRDLWGRSGRWESLVRWSRGGARPHDGRHDAPRPGRPRDVHGRRESRSAYGGCRSSTSRVATSRSATRTARSSRPERRAVQPRATARDLERERHAFREPLRHGDPSSPLRALRHRFPATLRGKFALARLGRSAAAGRSWRATGSGSSRSTGRAR